MGGKRMTTGICRLCGEHKKLSFEHIPPRSAFNDHQRVFQTIEDRLLKNRSHSKFRRGLGKVTLCESCNSNTGSWYGEAFVNWTKQGFEWFNKIGEGALINLPYNIKPLNVLKQTLVMALAMAPEGSLNYHEDLRRFVLCKKLKYCPPHYRVHVYFCKGGQPRFSSGMAIMKVGVGGGASYIEGEIALPPFGYSITTPFGSHRSLADVENLCEITWFAKYNYDEKRNIYLQIPIRETHEPFPLDYRSTEDMEKHRRKR